MICKGVFEVAQDAVDISVLINKLDTTWVETAAVSRSDKDIFRPGKTPKAKTNPTTITAECIIQRLFIC
jgi:hypothetical protein